VIEHEPEFLGTEADRGAAPEPIVRAAAHRRVELAGSGPDDGIPAEVWSLPTEELAAAFERAAAGAPELLLSDGPVPADIPLGNLGEARAAFAAHRAR
jgi:hypothetical protein